MHNHIRDHATTGLWLAVGLTLIANVLLPLQDALTKELVADFPIWEIIFVRSLTILGLTLLLGRTRVATRLVRTPFKRILLIRGLVMLGGWVAFYMALRTLPLAQAITLYFISPIIVSIASGPLLGERITRLQWCSVGVGFVGVVLASGLSEFHVSNAIFFALVSACLWAASLLMLRSMSGDEESLIQVAFSNGVFVTAMAVPLLFTGFAGTLHDIGWMAAIGVIGGAGQFALYEAARRVLAPVLSTLEYSSIITAFVLGYLMFGEVPTARLAVGALLVLISGLMIVWIEQERSRRAMLLGSTSRSEIVPVILNGDSRVSKEDNMQDATHDHVVNYIAKSRFPFPGQTTWAADYVTLTNVPERKRSIETPNGEHFPDIVIVDGTGRVREIGEVEMVVDAASVPYLKASSEIADSDTPTAVKHFFLYVPAGLEKDAQALLEDNGISYAGVRGFTVNPNGTVKIVPFVTKGDDYDHQVTDPAAA